MSLRMETVFVQGYTKPRGVRSVRVESVKQGVYVGEGCMTAAHPCRWKPCA